MMVALSTVLLALGFFPTLDLSTALIASLPIVLTVCELGRGRAITVFFSTSALGFLILPHNTAVFAYTSFFGFYPIVKSIVEVYTKRRTTAMILKFLYFTVATVLLLFIGAKLFNLDDMVKNHTVLFILLAEIFFIIYDFWLSRCISIYFKKIRIGLKIDKFFKR